MCVDQVVCFRSFFLSQEANFFVIELCDSGGVVVNLVVVICDKAVRLIN